MGPSSRVVKRFGHSSAAARHGSAYLGQAELPHELAAFVTAQINRLSLPCSCFDESHVCYDVRDTGSDKDKLRQDALDLYKHLRASSIAPERAAAKRLRQKDPRPKSTLPPYNHNVSLAYAAGVMPSVYAATYNVLRETKKRLGADWEPTHVVDFGSGTASAAWAVSEIWPTGLVKYTGIDESPAMLRFAEQALKMSNASSSVEMEWIKASLKTATTKPPVKMDKSNSMAIAAFTLAELQHPRDRSNAIEAIWNSGAEVIVVIERGTPAGFAVVAEARHTMLRMSKATSSPSCHVVAPCPHEHNCPLRFSKSFCHFSQRVQRPEFLKKTKHTNVNEEDSKFSYVVIRRSPRPVVSSDMMIASMQSRLGPVKEATSPVYAEPLQDADGKALHSPPLYEVSTLEHDASEEGQFNSEQVETAMKQDAYSWPRLIMPPMKRAGHVVLDACAASGNIERFIVTKSQLKQTYYDARKAKWGDSFPHQGAKEPQIRHKGTQLLSRADSVSKPGRVEQVSEVSEDQLFFETLSLSQDGDVYPKSVIDAFFSGSLDTNDLDMVKLGRSLRAQDEGEQLL